MGQDAFSLLQSVYPAGREEEEEEEESGTEVIKIKKNMDNVGGWSNMQM